MSIPVEATAAIDMKEYGMFGKTFGRLAPPDIDRQKLDDIRQNALRAVANGNDPVLAEVAREVRAGRLTLREAVVNPGYREAFAGAADNLMNALRNKSIDEFRKEAEENPEAVLVPPGHEDDEQADGRPPDPPRGAESPLGDDEYFDGEIMLPPSSTDRGGEDGAPPKRARWKRRA